MSGEDNSITRQKLDLIRAHNSEYGPIVIMHLSNGTITAIKVK